MSYELLVFKPAMGTDPLEQGKLKLLQSVAEIGRPMPGSDAFKAQMQSVILSIQPEYEVLETDFETIAEEEDISVSKAREKYRDVEISPAGDGLGPHVTIQDDQIIFTLPDEPDAGKARQAFEASWQLIAACAKVPGMRIYDGQINAMLRPDDTRDHQSAWQQYESIVVEAAKPWWKFW